MLRVPGNKILIALAVLFLSVQGVYALNEKKIVAYPVPFNPDRQTLKIGYVGVTPDSLTKVKIEIFDINGDRVYSYEQTSLTTPIIWNGRNSTGRIVKTGMYIIKIVIEDSNTGDHGKKIIRILVNR